MKSRNLLIKNLAIILIIVTVFTTSSCSKSTDDVINDTPSEPSNEYANYDFYMSHEGCGVVNEFSKNFVAIAGYSTAVNFNLIGSNLYTFGAKKYRSNPVSSYYTKSDNYSGFLSKNGVDIYSNIGGNSAAVIGVQESGSDLYIVTGFSTQDGFVSQYSVVCAPKIYKNGVLLNTLQGPFYNSSSFLTGASTSSYSFGIDVFKIIVQGNDVIVAGACNNFNSGVSSYGYWKNGIYTQIKSITNTGIYEKKIFSIYNTDYYYFLAISGQNFLYKNNTDILNGTLNNTAIQDFAVLNNDVYFLGRYYNNGYRLGIYKNGILVFNCIAGDTEYNIEIVDNKIFVCGSTINGEDKMTVFEYKTDSNSLTKVGNSPTPYQSCGAIDILNFQVVKK